MDFEVEVDEDPLGSSSHKGIMPSLQQFPSSGLNSVFTSIQPVSSRKSP
jgi:hypothetical protein